MRQIIRRRGDVPRDPAPSRWSYRAQRLWLTPLFRSVLRVGVPSFLIAGAVGLYASDPRISNSCRTLSRRSAARSRIGQSFESP